MISAARYWTIRLKRLLRRWYMAVVVCSTADTNPFLQRALRIETRKQKPLLTALGALLAAFLVNIIGWWSWEAWVQSQPAFMAERWAPGVFPAALGSNFMGFIGILTTLVCACAILYSSRARSAYLLRQEFLKDTLDQLHLLPLSEERWLWMMSAHPLRLSLLIGLLGLPIYLLELFTGQWAILDVIGLFVVFLMLGFAVPSWQPLFWKRQGARQRRHGVDVKKLRAATALVKADFDPARATAEQRLEMERRVQRVLVTLEDETAGTATAITTAGSGSTPQAGARVGRQLFSGGTARAVRAGAGWLLFNVFFQIMLAGMVGPRVAGPFGAVWQQLARVLPETVLALLPAFPLTWPLLLARLLFTPLPFFAFALPPILLVIPLWLGLSHQKLLSVAASVSNAETFWTARRARHTRSVALLLWIVTAWMVFGYGWHAIMMDGGITALLPGTPANVNWALAAAWTLAIVAGTLFAGMALEAPLRRHIGHDRPDQAAVLASWHAALRAMIGSLGSAILVYFVFCWLGGLSGISAAWMQRIVPTIATATAFLLAAFGSGASQSVLAGSPRVLCRIVRWIWFFGPALEAIVRVLRGWASGQPFSFDQAPHVLCSPFVTLCALFRQPLWQPEVQLGLLVQAVLGGVAFALAAALTMRPAPTQTGADEGRSLLDLLLAPVRALYRLWQAFWAALGRFGERVRQILGQCEEAIIRRAARYDNPVLTAHLRSKVRREHWPAQWLAVLALGATLMLLCAGSPLLLFLLDKIINGPNTSGVSLAEFLEDWGAMITYVVLGLGWLLAAVAGSDAGMAFDRDRASGSLVFLFLTPLTDRAIVGGKLVVSFFDVLCLLLTGLPWLFIGCLAGVIGGYLVLPLICLAGIAAVLSTLALATCLHTLFAVRAVKPGEGSAKALLCGVLIEVGCLVLFMYALPRPIDITAAFACTILLTVTLIHLAFAYGCWQLALYSMRLIRYGDVTVGGKGIG